MPSQSYLPSRDEELSTWAGNYSSKITATPVAYGLLAADATALAALVASFNTALGAATNPATRTAVTVASKDTAKVALVADIRSLARRIQATPSVTAAQKTELGLTVHDEVPSPVPPPATRPLVAVMSTAARMINIRLSDETTPTRRARPTGTSGAEVYSFVPTASEAPPADLENWRFEGMATRSDFAVDFNAADIGKSATIVARWFNRKGETGPVSNPITGTIAA